MVHHHVYVLGKRAALCRFVERLVVAAICVELAALTASVSLGQLPVAELNSISPAGAKVASQVQVTAFGANQDNATGLLFSHAGIKAVPHQVPRNEFQPELSPLAGQFDVTVSSEVPPGIYDVRLAGRFGISNPRSFVVGTHSEVSDNDNNRLFASSQSIQQPATINGIVEPSTTDYYKLHLAAGERVLVECLAQRIDSRMDATLALFSSDGRELQRNLDLIGQDPLIDFKAQAEGDYVIAVWDFLYEGGRDYFYRLNVDNHAHVDFIFPPAGLAGTRMAAKLFGRNIAGSFPSGREIVDGVLLEAKLINIDLPVRSDTLAFSGFLPSQTALLDGISYTTPDGASLFVGLARVPVIVELEPNNEVTAAQTVPVPCEIAGQFFSTRDNDVFQFEMRKGETYILDVISQRMGLPTDPVMIVERLLRDAEGKVTVSTIAQVDDPQNRNRLVGTSFDTSTDDPTYRLTSDSDATYRITVRDQFGDGQADPRWLYRLAIRPPQPDFRLHAVPEEFRVANPNEVRLTSLAIRRGGTAALKVSAERLDGFDSNIVLEVEGLPSGVHCASLVLGSTRDSATLVFNAAEDANAWTGPIRIIGRAELAGRSISHEARCGAILWGTANKTQVRPEFRLAKELYLAVIPEIIPAMVRVVADSPLETSVGGKLDIPLELVRRNGFAEAVKLIAQDLPAEIKPADVNIPADKSNGSLAVALTNANVKPGMYSFFLRSDSKVKYSRNPEAVVEAEAALLKLSGIVGELTTKTTEVKAARDISSQAPGATAESKAAADQVVLDSEATLKRATDLKAAEEKRVTDLKKSSEPTDVNLALVSTPIQLRIVRTPLKISLSNIQITLQRGQKVEIDANLERKYGFNDVVELSLEMPNDVVGLTSEKVALPADQTATKLSVSSTADAKPGNFTVTLRAKAKFNGIDVDDATTLALTIP